ncbi:hypothetical protein UFOVP55_53 [uncultured Caudovirales phage]|uniref:Uncharacterized protein n=1 Tax=uncultured Caudovirales phage TaxID=2100421 RepID=A0A6J5KV67_9CAUD|nr:hypothetical protein UFOVP55_53 [uncultured Caudovirales phage]
MRMGSTRLAIAFKNGKPLRLSTSGTDGQTVWYHHNKIAWRNADGSISLTLAGWGTITTRERLNTICDVLFGTRPFYQRDRVQYWRDDEITTTQVITYHQLDAVETIITKEAA